MTEDAMKHNLLKDKLFLTTTSTKAPCKRTLPQVLAALTSNNLGSFERLQAHQRQPWFCFLVQTAALAMNDWRHTLPSDDQVWHDRLLELTKGDEDAWCLVVDDVQKPAFMQSPIPEGSLEAGAYKTAVKTPDDLDILITAKNHDVKTRRMLFPEAEHWIHALITLQTLQGFLGRGNYGIARMNGGFASRSFASFAPGRSWGTRFARDVLVLMERRHDLLADGQRAGYVDKGPSLLWLEPWDGKKESMLPLWKNDPFFIEICRRIRFTYQSDTLVCLRANTQAARIDAPSELKGITKAPWGAQDVGKTNKAFTPSAKGFHYSVVQRFFDQSLTRSPAMEKSAHDTPQGFMWLTCLVRGQGKTEGFHERLVFLSQHIKRSLFGNSTESAHLALRSKEQVRLADLARKNILLPALLTLLHGGNSGERSDNRLMSYASTWTQALDGAIDRIFFEQLDALLGMEKEHAFHHWKLQLCDLAYAQLQDAMQSVPLPSARRYKALSAAQSQFDALVEKHFHLKEEKEHAKTQLEEAAHE